MRLNSWLLKAIAFGALGGTSATLFCEFGVTITVLGAIFGAILSGVLAVLADRAHTKSGV